MKVHLVYFSPNGTTQRSLRNIAEGLGGLDVLEYDLLTPDSRKKKYHFTRDDLVILGFATAGMLYGKTSEVFACIQGTDTPMVGVALYGNGYYGVALTEMKQKAGENGFLVCAMGAFIGQHAIYNQVAAGRPDEKDKSIQVDFGKAIYEKVVINKDIHLHQEPRVGWSGLEWFDQVIKYRQTHTEEYRLPAEYKTKVISDDCNQCGICVSYCPVDAINIEEKEFDLEKCIGCYGCVNRCPVDAISVTSEEMNKVGESFALAFQKRREPELFM